MRRKSIWVCSLLLAGSFSPTVWAQDKAKTDEKARTEVQTTPVKLQVVVAEYENDKKIKSLPYVLYVNAPHQAEIRAGGSSRLRIGSRVPIYVGKNEMQYLDVGTNIDVRSAFPEDGVLILALNLERSWAEGDVSVPVTRPEAAPGDSASSHFPDPIIRNFRSELDLKLREGQTAESLVATDPLSGRVVRVEVGFSILK